MWHGEVVQLDSDRYYELQSVGWEPVNFILVPDPRPKHGLATLNGDGGVAQSFVTFVGMRINWLCQDHGPAYCGPCSVGHPPNKLSDAFGVDLEGSK